MLILTYIKPKDGLPNLKGSLLLIPSQAIALANRKVTAEGYRVILHKCGPYRNLHLLSILPDKRGSLDSAGSFEFFHDDEPVHV